MTSKLSEAPVEEAGANHHVKGLLTLQDIIEADDVQMEYVDMRPYWEGTVRVKGLTGEERARVFAAIDAHGKQIRDEDAASRLYYARVIVASLVDDDGRRIAKQDDAPAFAKKNGAALSRLFKVCARLSGLGDEELDKAKTGLKEIPSDDSGID